jgi:hypothetical protein
MDVGSADAHGLDADEDLVILGSWRRDVSEFKRERSRVHQRFHDGNLQYGERVTAS